MLAVVVSRPDEASVAIGEALRELADWDSRTDESRPDEKGGGRVYRTDGVELRTFGTRHLDLVGPAVAFDDADLLVFASKHAGETGPLLTAHHTGNFGPADHGGDDHSLAPACPFAHATVLEALAAHAPPGYDVGMEATHHGPTDVGAPSMFVEVGSGPEQWADPAAAAAVARAILDLRETPPSHPGEATADPAGVDSSTDGTPRHLVGLGGGHYAPRFERLVRETDWAVGHVAPDWGLDAMGDPSSPTARGVLRAAFESSNAQYGLVDGDYPAVESTVGDLGYDLVSETWLRETDGVPLELVDRLETEVAGVDEGLRFGDAVSKWAGKQSVLEVPAELLAAANDIDARSVRAAVAERSIAFVTDENGTRVVGPVVALPVVGRDGVVEALLPVLREGYDAVTWDGDVVEARRERFDPERAAELGVSEGPAFGRLASGTSVEVDGRDIDPEAVHTTEIDRFDL
jgi:D-aminoacyl-tRNA deacylase